MLLRKKNLFEGILFSFWIVLSLGVLLFHEPWRDELQAWLIARDCTLPEIFHLMKDEGHFLGWFLLLKVLNILKQPLFSLNILSWFLTVPAVFLLLFRSPFGRGTKLFLILSSPILYWFPVVSRCYSMIPPLLFLTALLYPTRKKHPFLYGCLLFVLGNVHPVMEGLLLFLFLDLLRDWYYDSAPDRKNYLCSAGLLLAGVLLAFLTVIRAAGEHGTQLKGGWRSLYFELPFWNVHPFGVAWLSCSRYWFLPAAAGGILILILFFRKCKYVWPVLLFIGIGTFFFFRGSVPLLNPAILLWETGMLALLLPFSREDRFYSAGMILFFLWYTIMMVFFCGIIHQRAFLPLLAAVFMSWIASERMDANCGKNFLSRKSRFLILLAWLTIPGGLYVTVADIRQPFSGADDCSIFLESQPRESTLGTFYETDICSMLSAYTGKKIYSFRRDRTFTWCPRDKGKLFPISEILKRGKANQDLLILQKCRGIPETFRLNQRLYRKVYETPFGPLIQDESFMVYRYQPEGK